MTFDQWLNEIENCSSRYERILEDVYGPEGYITRWLEAAYKVGYQAGVEEKHNAEYDV